MHPTIRWLAAGLCLAVASSILLHLRTSNAPRASLVAASSAANVDSPAPARRFGALSLHFEPGPRDGDFVARHAGLAMTLQSNGASFQLVRQTQIASVDLRLEGASPRAVHPENPLPGVSNYFIGTDPNAWRTGVPHFARVRYEQVYPGIDLVYYGHAGTLEYDFLVAPGADPARIRMSYARARHIRIASNGDLHIDVGDGMLVHRAPVSFQIAADGSREHVDSRFELSDGMVSFKLGPWDRTRPLVIDPVLTFATYFGGSDDPEQVQALHVDLAGNIYIAGFTASTNLPVSAGAAQLALGGQLDAFVAKLDPTGSSLLYCTYLGGSGQDSARLLRVDVAGNVYLLGQTTSSNFPVSTTAPQTTLGGAFDAFVAKLNATGTAVIYATYLGGSGSEPASDKFGGFAIDNAGDVYVYGDTDSTNFPVTAGAPQTSRGNPGAGQFDQDVFLTRINAAGTEFTFSTYHGGAGIESVGDLVDEGHLLALDGSGRAWLAGTTESTNLPVTGNVPDSTPNGGSDFFVARFDTGASARLMSTYLGGAGDDIAESLALSGIDDALVAGEVTSGFPVTVGAADTTFNGGGSDIGIAKITAANGQLAFATYLGGNSREALIGMRNRNADGSVYVAGSTQSQNFPATAGAADTTYNGGGNDGFVARLSQDGAQLLYVTLIGSSDSDGVTLFEIDSDGSAYALLGDSIGDGFVGSGGRARVGGFDDYFVKVHPNGSVFLDASYLGGGDDDFSTAMHVDTFGNLYLGGTTKSTDFPTTAGTIQPTKPQTGANDDMFLAKFATTAPGGSGAPAGTLGFTAAGFTVAENAGAVGITVSRTGGSAGAVSASCSAASVGADTAEAGTDYTATSVVLNWADGDASNKVCTVAITDDAVDEGDETFTVSLANPTGGATVSAPTTVTITDNDATPTPQPGTVSFAPATYSINENGGSVALTLTRTLGADGAIAVSVTSTGGSASSGADYTAISQTVNWADGDSAPKTVSLTILDDTADESDEAVTVELANATGGATLGTSTATVTIVDDDQPIGPPGPTLQSTTVKGQYGGGSFDAWLLAALALSALAAAARRQHNRALVRAVAAAAALATAPLSASAADVDWYVGVRAGVSETTQTARELESALASRGHAVSVNLDDQQPSLSLLAGYRFSNGFSIEAVLVDLGKFAVGVTGETTDPSALLADTERLLGVSARGLGTTIGWTIVAGERLEITPRLGLYYAESRQSVSSSAGRIVDTESDTDFVAGVRLAWRANDRWRIGLDVEGWAAGASNDVRSIVLLVTYAPGARLRR